MPTWKSRGLRGSALEDMINYTIEQYSTKKACANSEDSDSNKTNQY